MQVIVVMASRLEQIEVEVMLPVGTLVGDALQRAGELNPAITDALAAGADVGVWGKAVRRDAALRDGDRVELYRPLLADPKETRRRRARKKAANP